MASSADDRDSTSHHILYCIHAARKPCSDRCWYYWFTKQPSPASINNLSPDPVDISSLKQKEVRLKAKQERHVKLRTKGGEVGSAFTAVGKYSNQEGKTVKAPEAQAGGAGDMDAVDHMIDILAEDSSMHQPSIQAPQKPPHTPAHACGSQDAAQTPKKSPSPHFTLLALNSPTSAGYKRLSSASETNQLLSNFKPSKRKHSEDTTSDTPNKRPSSTSTSISTSTQKPSSSSNTNIEEDAMDNITMGDVVTEVDVTLTMDEEKIAKRKHSTDATLDTPNKRPSFSPNIEDTSTSEVVHGNNDFFTSVNTSNDTTLTSIPQTPPHQEILLETPGAPVKPTSKRKHSVDASHSTPNKRQTPSSMLPSTPSATTTPQSTTNLTAHMQGRISSVSTARRARLTFPYQSMPPEGASNTFPTRLSTPVQRRVSAVASFETSTQSTSSPSLMVAVLATPSSKDRDSGEEPMTPQSTTTKDTQVGEVERETEEGGKGEGVNIFDLIIAHLPSKSTTNPSTVDEAEDVYPTPAKESSLTPTSLYKDAETPVQRKLFDNSSSATQTSKDVVFENLPVSTQDGGRAQTPASRASSSARVGKAGVTFDDAPVVIYGGEAPSVARKRKSASSLKEAAPAKDVPVTDPFPGTRVGAEISNSAFREEKVQEIQAKVTAIITKQAAKAAPFAATEKNLNAAKEAEGIIAKQGAKAESYSAGKKAVIEKKVEVIDLISDDDEDALPDLSAVIGCPQPPGAPICHDKLPHSKAKQPAPKVKPAIKKSVTDIWKTAAAKSPKSTSNGPTKATSEALLAVQQARGVKTVVLKQSLTTTPPEPELANGGTTLIDNIQASGAIAHPTVYICGVEVELQILYDLVNEKYGGYEKVEDCDFWGRIATGLNLSKHPGANTELRRVYRETLLNVGKSADKAIAVVENAPVLDLEAMRKVVQSEPTGEMETDLSEERAIFLSKLGAQAIEPVQHICGTNIDMFLLSIVVGKKGGFDVVESQNLWPRIARTLMFGSEAEEKAAAELQRVYTELRLYLDEDISSSQPISVLHEDGKKVIKPKKPDMVFDQASLNKFLDQVKHVCASSNQEFEESIDICDTEIHVFDLWAIVKHKLGGYQKTVVYDKWSRAATLLGFNLSKKSDRNAAVAIQAVWDRLLRNVYIDIAPKYQTPDGPPRSGKDGTLRFSAVEASMLEDAFRGEGKLPGKEVRERLSREMNVTRASINNWFYARSSKANLEKRAWAQAAKKIPDDAEIIDLDLSVQERREVDLDQQHFCQVEGCGRSRVLEKYRGVQEAQEYIGSMVGELIAINEDGGQVVEEGADEMELERPTSPKRRIAMVPGVGAAYRIRVKHTCGMTESEAGESWGVIEQEDDDPAVGSEAGPMDHWEDPKEYNAVDGIERFAGMRAKDFEDDEESNEEWNQRDEEWDHDMAVAHLKDKTAQEIRAKIAEQFGSFSFSRKYSGATEREDISPYGTVRKVFENEVVQTIDNDIHPSSIHPSSQRVAPTEDVEMTDPTEVAGSIIVPPAEDPLFEGQSPALAAPSPLMAPVADMGQASYPKKSSTKYAKSKDGKPFWPSDQQMIELDELVKSCRSSSRADQTGADEDGQSAEGSLHVQHEASANADRMVDSGRKDAQLDLAQDEDLDEQMGGMEETPEIDGDLKDIGESVLKKQKERQAANGDEAIAEAQLSPAAEYIIASIETSSLPPEPVGTRDDAHTGGSPSEESRQSKRFRYLPSGESRSG